MVKKRNKRSGYDKYKKEIEELLRIGITKRSCWKLINNRMREYERLSYQAFLNFLQKRKIN